MSVEGKIVARIEENVDGYDAVTLVVFTDGTALKVTAHGYEDPTVEVRPIDPEAVAEHEQERAERLERERKAREEREAFLALPKDERDRLEAERRAKMTPFHLAMEDAMREMARSMVAHMSRAATFDGGFTIPVGAKKGKARRT